MNENIQSLTGFIWWTKKMRKKYFESCIMLFLIMTFFISIIWFAGIDKLTGKDIIFIAIMVFLFGGFGISQLKLYIRTFNWKIDRYWYGTITEIQRIKGSKGKTKGYRITADVGGKQLEGICLPRTYQQAEIGQQVLIFSLDSDTLYCVHPEM